MKCFNDVTHLYRCHPITILNNDDIPPNNDVEDSNPTETFDQPQNQKVISASLPQRGSTFKLKEINLFTNIKVFTEKVFTSLTSFN